MPSLEDITVDTTEFSPHEALENRQSKEHKVWISEEIHEFPDVVILEYFDTRSPYPAPVVEIDKIRDNLREAISRAGSAIIEIEHISIQGVPSLWVVYKTPQDPSGMMYSGSLTLPFRKFTYRIEFKSPEHGMTGVRDNAILRQFWEQQGGFDENDPFKGWSQDPYNPFFKEELMRNVSEDAKYDSKFPTHPLTRIRRLMKKVNDSIDLSPEVKSSPIF